MAWIRLDDQIAHHPKFLKAGPVASWLWVCCIGYSQKFLTNGFIPAEALPTLGTVADADKLVQKLVDIGLMELATDGYQIHHYLDFNEHAEEVKRRRHQDRVRKESSRNPAGIQPESARIPSASRARDPIPSVPIPKISNRNNKQSTDACVSTTSEKHSNGNGGGRSKRPIFSGQRITVFEWQFDDLTRMLGPLTDAFDLHEWFYAVDAEALKSEVVIPIRDNGVWLQTQMLAEAERRGLTLVASASKPKSKSEGVPKLLYRPFECPHTPQCTGRSACDVLQRLGR